MAKSLARVLNWRSLTLLTSVTGLSIAMHLTALDLQERVPLCGATQSCATVLGSKYAHLGPIPTSGLGILFYAMAVFWLVLEMTGGKFAKIAGFVWSSVGLVTSAVLMYLAIFKIHAVCQWCLGSAVCTAVLFACWGQIAAQEPRQFQLLWRALFSFSTIFVGFLSFLLPFASVGEGQDKPVPFSATAVISRPNAQIIPEPSHTIGTGPPTIVFFGDLSCPACRYWYPKFRSLARTKDARLAYRHFLKHESALSMMELAEEVPPAKFWDYLDEGFAVDQDSDDEEKLIKKWSKSVVGRKSGRKRVDSDSELAKSLGFELTPTIVWIDDKGERRVLGPTAAYNELSKMTNKTQPDEPKAKPLSV